MVRTFNYQRASSAPPATLLDFLTSKFTYHTREQWRATIVEKKWVLVDGALCTDPDFILPQKACIGFEVPAEAEPEVDERMTLLFADEDIVVVSKSGNIPVAEGGRYSKRTLINVAPRVLAEELKRIDGDGKNNNMNDNDKLFAVHRLDKETSGIVVMARTLEATQRLGAQFARIADEATGVDGPPVRRNRSSQTNNSNNDDDDDDDDDNGQQCLSSAAAPKVQKEYIAVLQGNLQRELDINLRIGFEHEMETTPSTSPGVPARKLKKMRMKCAPESSSNNTAFAKGTKDARTIVTPLLHSKKETSLIDLTVCRVQLFTGRTHQIRVHCASVGFPLVGEKLYVAGGGTVDCDTYLERARGNLKVTHEGAASSAAAASSSSSSLTASRHLLHAALLKFEHPTTGIPMTFKSDPFPAFLEACPQLRDCFESLSC